MSDTETPEVVEPQVVVYRDKAPTPADVAAQEQSAKKLREPSKSEDEDDDDVIPRDPQDYERALERAKRLRNEARTLREQLKEAEPIVKAHREAQEAAKTEIQRAQERAEELEQKYSTLQQDNWRLDLAVQFGVPRDEIDLIGSGSREEMEARAARLGPLFATSEKTPPPPSNRPVEGLRPGASPEPPKPADNSYPAEWGFQPQRQT